MTFMVVDKRGRVTLPAGIRKELGLDGEAPHVVLLSRTPHGTFELVPAALIPREQLWFHHPEVQERIAEAEADFREGSFTRTDTPQDAQAYLDQLKESSPGCA